MTNGDKPLVLICYITNGIRKNSYCPSGVTNAVLYTSSGYLPVSFGQIDLGKIFLATQSTKAVVMGSGSTSVVLFNFLKSTHPLKTILLLNPDDG